MVIRHNLYGERCVIAGATLNPEEAVFVICCVNKQLNPCMAMTAKVIGTSRTGN